MQITSSGLLRYCETEYFREFCGEEMAGKIVRLVEHVDKTTI